MSELIDNVQQKKALLKHMILQLHEGQAPEAVRHQLARVMGEVPYHLVVEVEQELLLNEGLSREKILELCDIHTAALRGQVHHDGAKTAPSGHPVHTFREENRALQWELDSLDKLSEAVCGLGEDDDAAELMAQVQMKCNALADIEKHYARKENLLFPYLENHGITGPSTVMWGKHDETRELLKGALETLPQALDVRAAEARAVIELVIDPLKQSIEAMILKEEEILFPMSLDTLNDTEWYEIYKQSPEVGFCLYDPTDKWRPDTTEDPVEAVKEPDRIRLPSGSLAPAELDAILNSIPFDLTFVDKDDRVRYFTQGRERIFSRSRAILGRKVQMCHPPSSVHIVQQILEDFHSGRQSRAPFWINLRGRFIHIEYLALRDEDGNYLGTLEVSQDLTEKRALNGEQRLLSYAGD